MEKLATLSRFFWFAESCIYFLLNFRESNSAAVSSRFVEDSVKLIYGKDSDVIKERRFAGLQALSGTGACRLFAEFQRHFHPDVPIFLPEPTWSK